MRVVGKIVWVFSVVVVLLAVVQLSLLWLFGRDGLLSRRVYSLYGSGAALSDDETRDLAKTLLSLVVVGALCLIVQFNRPLWGLYRRVLDNRLAACAESRARTRKEQPEPEEKKRALKLKKQQEKRRRREQLK